MSKCTCKSTLGHSRSCAMFDESMMAPPKFPTMLRKMWSGAEVQAWLDEHVRTAAGAELQSMTRMFHAACADLCAINQALGLDPNDGGAQPILAAIAALKGEGAINTHELRQAIGEKLTDKLGEMIGTEGPMDPHDSRDVDMLLDAFMPTIEGLTVTRTAYDELVADRDRLLVELQRRRDVERGNVWHWQTDGGNALESLACPVIIHSAALRELLPEWHTCTPPTKENDYDEYIVAVRRAHDKRKVFVFAANYANKFKKDELNDQDGNEYVPDGWYDVGHDMSGEFDALWQPMLGEGDEVVGWQHKPKWVNS